MRCLFVTSAIGFVTTTSSLVVSDYSHTLVEQKSLQPTSQDEKSWTILDNNSRHTVNESPINKAAILDSIPQRALLGFIPRISHKESLPSKPLNPVSTTRKCQHSTVKNGKLRQLEGCDSGEYIVFAQSYMPTVMTTGTLKLLRNVDPHEVYDWNNNLKIHGLWPQKSKMKSTLPFTDEARAAVKTDSWPKFLKNRNFDLYLHEWQTHGIASGLTPHQYINEINRLHELHKTPPVITVRKTETYISLATLKAGFNLNGCLVCKIHNNAKFFFGVQYCHKVDSQTRMAKEIVPFKNCGQCDPRTECNGPKIVIPKIGRDDSGEYSIFAQSYMPTVMTTGTLKFVRDIEPDEVDDWNSNFKIHGLWPHYYEVAKSPLPFTEEARNEVNKRNWPITLKKVQLDLYLQDWEKYGVKSGFTPVQYIREINRLHESHKTPPVFAELKTQTSISIAALKAAFHPNACLVCKTKNNEKYFLDVQYCHVVNSETRHAEEVVPFEKCGQCARNMECNQENIIIPKLTHRECKTSEDCDSNEYMVFSQSYMPTIMTTGQEDRRRKCEPDEVDDWNTNLKIHGLWPTNSKSTKSTLPFTAEARKEVDEKAWPMVRKVERELYTYQWETHGVESGLEPVEYIREINRVHRRHPTPPLLREPIPTKVQLATLHAAFGSTSVCLLCHYHKKVQLFSEVKYCHRMNSATRKAEELVAHENCGYCSKKLICKEDYIYIPKIGYGIETKSELEGKGIATTSKNEINKTARKGRKNQMKRLTRSESST